MVLVEHRFIRSTRKKGAVIVVTKTTIPTGASTRPKNVFIAKTSGTQRRCVAKRKKKLKKRNRQDVVALEVTPNNG